MLSLRSEARQALDQFLGQVTGTLLVGASTIPGEYVLPPSSAASASGTRASPITLQISDSRGIVQSVLDGQVDAGSGGRDPSGRGLEVKP
jgi:DNA-binding transcriptional LysR family regulator